MRRSSSTRAAGIVLWTVCVVGLSPLAAHDYGIVKTRLFEETPGTYRLEVDTDPFGIADLAPPVLPPRFERPPSVEYDVDPQHATIRYRFDHPTEPLEPGDRLLLPWNRDGALVTAGWADGTVERAFFRRGAVGIRIDVGDLRPHAATDDVATLRSIATTWRDPIFLLARLLLIVALALACGGRGWLRAWLGLVAGQVAAMAAADLTRLAPPEGLVALLYLAAALLLARQAVTGGFRAERWFPPLALLGLIEGTALAGTLRATVADDGALAARLLLLAIVLGALDWVGLAVLGTLVRLVVGARDLAAHAVGAVAVALALGLTVGGAGYPSLPKTTAGIETLPAPSPSRLAAGSGRPLELFLTIEPYEVRLQSLIRPGALSIPGIALPVTLRPADRVELTRAVREWASGTTAVTIDGAVATPVTVEADLVRSDANGVLPLVLDERGVSSEDALFGVTWRYPTDGLAGEVAVAWQALDVPLAAVPLAVSGPFGSRRALLTHERPRFYWTNPLPGFRTEAPRAVAVAPRRVPLLSLLLWIVSGVIAVRAGAPAGRRRVAAIVLLAGVLTYPFVRTPLPVAVRSRPSPERAERVLRPLLEGVYHAFDLSDEQTVYDRLSVSVTGEQLTEIYLDTRRTLDAADRGGARGRFERLERLDVRGVEGLGEGGFAADTVWEVRGSVGHFGHTHFRLQRNRARIEVVPVDGAWKIRRIDVVDEQRLSRAPGRRGSPVASSWIAHVLTGGRV